MNNRIFYFSTASGTVWAEAVRNFESPTSLLIVQFLVVLIFSRACAYALRKLGQPAVNGEIIAGLLLGKSVFAQVWPLGFAWLFPEASMPRLFLFSQIGLVFFMFVVGLHLNFDDLKGKGPTAVLISHVSIVLPFTLGVAAALAIFTTYGPDGGSFVSFALFMGIAMSITAFPVLARILAEKKMTSTPLGVLALSCAAIDDVTAWCLLAAIVGIVKSGTVVTAVTVLVSGIAYVALMLKVVRPFAARILKPSLDGAFNSSRLAFVFCVLLFSSLISETIGLHVLFGAFLAGVVMPQSISFRTSVADRVETFTSILLLPLFFVYTGLRTQISLLSRWRDWLVCLALIALATLGKMAGSAFAARWSGMSWRDSFAIGALLNSRGLMELIALNVGLDLGILPPTLFAMMVLMAIATTLMTSPLISYLLPTRSTVSTRNLVPR